MAEKNIKSGRGGARPGAGRPRKQEGSKLYTFRASGEIEIGRASCRERV